MRVHGHVLGDQQPRQAVVAERGPHRLELGLGLAPLARRIAHRDPEGALDLVALRADLADVPRLDLAVEERVRHRQPLGLARQREAEDEVQREQPQQDPPEAAARTGEHRRALRLLLRSLGLRMPLHAPGPAIAVGLLPRGSLTHVGHRVWGEPTRCRRAV